MYYKKHDEIPPIPSELKHALLEAVHNELKVNSKIVGWGTYENTDTNSIAYVESGKELDETHGLVTGSVNFYPIPHELKQKIIDYYDKINHPLINNGDYFFQVVEGSTFVSPHIDASYERKQGLMYLLEAGGDDVRTRWYKAKDEFKNLTLTEGMAIPYSRVDVVEDVRLTEDCWHWLNFNEIHSVENQKSVRLALWGIPR